MSVELQHYGTTAHLFKEGVIGQSRRAVNLHRQVLQDHRNSPGVHGLGVFVLVSRGVLQLWITIGGTIHVNHLRY